MRARTLLDPLLETDGWASVWSTSDYSSLTRGIVRYYQGRLDEAVEHLTAALASSYPDRKPPAIAA